MFEERLVREIRERKCLYEKIHRDYNNYKMKEMAWDEISAILGTPVNKCKARWKSLRERYVREVKRNIRMGCPLDNSSWHLFSKMSFIKAFICPRSRTPNSTQDNEDGSYGPYERPGVEVNQTGNHMNELMEILSDSDCEPEVSFQTPRITAAFSNSREPDNESVRSNSEDFNNSHHSGMQTQEMNIHPPTISPSNAGFFLMLDKMLQNLPPEDVVNFQMDILNFVHKKTIDRMTKQENDYAFYE